MYAFCIDWMKMPRDPHWRFCHSMLFKDVGGFPQIVQLDKDLAETITICYLILRALDNVEDDATLASEVKVSIMMDFHNSIYNTQWCFPCGKKHHKVLMVEFHHVTSAFLELDRSRQELIKDTTKRMGAGMAKFICKEMETIDDYDEYGYYVSGLVVEFLSKLFHYHAGEDLPSDTLSNSVGLFLQKADTIYDYLEDVNEKPKPRLLWPRQIWSKYADNLEDFKYIENSVKAVQCLNDMVTNALSHAEDCLKFLSSLRNPRILHLWACPHVLAYGGLALCYNDIQVLRGHWILRPGLVAKLVLQTRTMADVYRSFYDLSCLLKSKFLREFFLRTIYYFQIDDSDPNAEKTKEIVDAIIKICRNSGTLDQRKPLNIIQRKPPYKAFVFLIFTMLAVVLSYLYVSLSP